MVPAGVAEQKPGSWDRCPACQSAGAGRALGGSEDGWGGSKGRRGPGREARGRGGEGAGRLLRSSLPGHETFMRCAFSRRAVVPVVSDAERS